MSKRMNYAELMELVAYVLKQQEEQPKNIRVNYSIHRIPIRVLVTFSKRNNYKSVRIEYIEEDNERYADVCINDDFHLYSSHFGLQYWINEVEKAKFKQVEF